ncbi:MAG: rRNA maturation RNase YbeY [Cyanobacteriota bacterium]|nr:rRNA maturation RNase YbeY [Cyanobacteriota bacterium]
MELDLALDAAAAPWSPDDPQQLSDETAWHRDLMGWIQTIRSTPSLTCPDAVRRADEVSLGLRFTDDASIAELNSAWRQKTGPTDVLSFAALDDAGDWMEGPSPELGDIIISLETARRQAQEQGHSLQRELRWLVSHGLLHLLGWDHPDDPSLEAMLQLQEQLLDSGGNVHSRRDLPVESDINGHAH